MILFSLVTFSLLLQTALATNNMLSRSQPKSLLTTAQRAIVWVRNEQRVHDNALFQAAKSLELPILCVYCFDPRHFERTAFGEKKTGIFRAKFLTQSIQNFRENLHPLGVNLLVAFERPENLFERLLDSDTAIIFQTETAYEEKTVERAVEMISTSKGAGIVKLQSDATLYHRDDIPFAKDLKDMPDTFTPFKEKVEKYAKVRPLSEELEPFPAFPVDEKLTSACSDKCSFSYLPNEVDLGFDANSFASASGTSGVLQFVGGETAALARISKWMFEDDRLKDYFDIRNGMLGEAYSSKLSPWLALGNVSPRLIYSEVKRYEAIRGIANKSTYWLIFELVWRDFFRFICSKYGSKIFFPGGAKGLKTNWSLDRDKIERWKNGKTGKPLVDANMRELKATGFMSNRGRQNVASYLVLDLNIDWRVGADYFESYLLDHDVYSNYGNWNAAACLFGGRVNKFNITKQSKDYDPRGEYIKYWVPELRRIPAPSLFEPWTLSIENQRKFGVSIGETYPEPVSASTKLLGDSTNDRRDHKGSADRRPCLFRQEDARSAFIVDGGVPDASSTSSSGGRRDFKGGGSKRPTRVQHF